MASRAHHSESQCWYTFAAAFAAMRPSRTLAIRWPAAMPLIIARSTPFDDSGSSRQAASPTMDQAGCAGCAAMRQVTPAPLDCPIGVSLRKLTGTQLVGGREPSAATRVQWYSPGCTMAVQTHPLESPPAPARHRARNKTRRHSRIVRSAAATARPWQCRAGAKASLPALSRPRGSGRKTVRRRSARELRSPVPVARDRSRRAGAPRRLAYLHNRAGADRTWSVRPGTRAMRRPGRCRRAGTASGHPQLSQMPEWRAPTVA